SKTGYHLCCHSEYPIPRRAIRAGKEPMAHIQHLGFCLLDCGAQPRFLPGAAVRRACPVHCLNAPASWSAERELRFGGESAALAAHSKTSCAGTGLVDLSRTALFMSSEAKKLIETLSGVYPERSRRAQGDKFDVSISCSLV